jgi:hypothetical protein
VASRAGPDAAGGFITPKRGFVTGLLSGGWGDCRISGILIHPSSDRL